MNKDLNTSLQYIGLNITGGKSNKKINFDIEGTLVNALLIAERERDSKLLSLMLSWLHVYSSYVIPEKLRKHYLRTKTIDDSSIYFNIFCIYAFEILKEHQFKKLIFKNEISYLTDVKKDKVAIKINGEEEFCKKYRIHIPKNVLRIRASDVVEIKSLVKRNDQISNRLLIGANWRADIITEIQRTDDSAYKIANRLGCSYEPVHRIMKQYKLVS